AVRQRVDGQDLSGVVGGQRHLRGADQVQVVVLQVVDLVGVFTEESGAFHRFGFDQDRRDHGGETILDGLVHRRVEQRQLQVRTHTGEEVEPRTGDRGSAFGVDGTEHLTQVQVIAWGEVERGDLTDRLQDLEVV